MAKSRKSASSSRAVRGTGSAKSAGRRGGSAAAMPRSMQNRGRGDSRKAVQQPAKGRTTREHSDPNAVTRVTRETEVRGKETRVESVVERAPKPTVSANRTERGRYVYCIIRASAPLKFGAIGMDEEGADVSTINYKDMAAVVSDVPMTPLDSTRENVLAHERVNETVMRDHTVIPMSNRAV